MARRLLFDASMADATQWERFDWHLLMNSHLHRVPRASDLDVAGGRLVDLGYVVRSAQANSWAEVDDMHDDLSVLLDFPDYYGRNLDALNDVMAGVAMFEHGSDPTATGTALLIAGFQDFHEREPRAGQAVLDIFAIQARMAMVVGHPMLCIVESRVWHDGVGAMPVMPVHEALLRSS